MTSRWRVDDLAEETALTVDTIRFYQKRRLLPPPIREGRVAWYDESHIDRLRQIRQLQQEGLPLALIARLLEGDLGAADQLLAEAVAGRRTSKAGEARFDRTQLALHSGVSIGLIDTLTAAGLLVPQSVDGSELYGAADAELVATGLRLLGAGLPLDDLLQLAAQYHEATASVAHHAVAMFDEHVREPILSGPGTAADKAERLVDAFDTLFPAVTSLVGHHFGGLLLDLAREALEEGRSDRAREASA